MKDLSDKFVAVKYVQFPNRSLDGTSSIKLYNCFGFPFKTTCNQITSRLIRNTNVLFTLVETVAFIDNVP